KEGDEMQDRRIAILASLLVAAFAVAGCHHKDKKQNGKIEGDFKTPDSSSSTTQTKTTPPPIINPKEGEIPGESEAQLRAVYFDFDRYDIRTDQRSTLESDAKWLVGNPDKAVI